MAEPFVSQYTDFSGGEVNSVEPLLLQPNQLQKAENARFSLAGGFTNRPGYQELTLPSITNMSGRIQGMLETSYGIVYACNGRIYLTNSTVTDAWEIHSGLDTSANVCFFEFNGDIFVQNGIDRPRRIAVTYTASALVALTSTSLTVSTGQGWRFGSTGTLFVIGASGEAITYTARTNDTITVTAATIANDAAIDSILIEVTTLSSAPIAKYGAVFQNTWFMTAMKPSGVSINYTENILTWSVGATGLNPEKFWDFSGTGAGYKPVGSKGATTGLKETKNYLAITKRGQVFYCSGFDSDNDATIGLITDAYGAVNQNCITTLGSSFAVFAGNEIKIIGEQEGLNNTVPSVDPGYDKVFTKYLQSLPYNQDTACFTYNPIEQLAKCWVTKSDGTQEVIVIDTKRGGWVRDTNKPAGCACYYKGKTYWGHGLEAKIFIDEYGYSDNGLDIITTVRTKDDNAGSVRLSKYFKYKHVTGSLIENTIVQVNVYEDDVIILTYNITDAYINITAGGGIGIDFIGGVSIGGSSSSDGVTAYPFEIEKLLPKRRNTGKISVEYICTGQGQYFEIKTQEIAGTVGMKFDRQIRQ